MLIPALKNCAVWVLFNSFCFYVNLSWAYSVLSIENEKVCSPFHKKREIKLDRFNNSAVVVKETRYFDFWSQDEFKCEFTVKAKRRDGVIAVIQYLSLRKDEDTGKCVDFIQFTQDSGKTSPRYCGKMMTFKPVLVPSGSQTNDFANIAANAFVDPKGEMKVKIQVGSKIISQKDDIDLEIAFTSYSDCSGSKEDYLPCGSSDMCISRYLFDDGVVNCPFINCVDEGNCFKISGNNNHSTTPIVVSTLTGFALSFIFFFICICILRYKKKLCWSDQSRSSGGSRPNRPPIDTPSPEEDDELAPVGFRFSTAPPDDTAAVSPEKDLPPSYDSLFPGR